MSNRSLRNNRRYRYSARQRGGSVPAFGNGVYDALAGMISGASTTGAGSGPMVPIESRAPTDTQCDQIPRTSIPLHNQANPDIAGTNQYPILGGNMSVYPFTGTVPPVSNAVSFPDPRINANQQGGKRSDGKRGKQGGGKQGDRKRRKTRKTQRGGGCGCMGQRGGSRSGGRRQRGGGSPQGLAQFPDAFALSGGGPNVGNPVNMQSGCDPRAGSPQDPHAPINMMRQSGGSYSSIASAAPLDAAFPSTPQPSYGAANAFPESCYKAPGSEMPVYNNNSAAFNFSPSIVENNTLPPGVNVYNDVIQQPGRMGPPAVNQRGGRRSRKNNRKSNRIMYRKSRRNNLELM